MTRNSYLCRIIALFFVCFIASSAPFAQREMLAHWRFEQVQDIKGDTAASVAGQLLTADDRRPADPQLFAFDNSGKGNFLLVRGSRPSPIVFCDNVPSAQVNGMPNTRSLAIKRGEYVVTFERPLAFYDMQKSWMIEASLLCNLPGTEQVFLGKEGAKGTIAGDVSIGFEPMQKKCFVEVMCADGVPRRIVAGDDVEPGKWYDVRAHADCDIKAGLTKLILEVKTSGQPHFARQAQLLTKVRP